MVDFGALAREGIRPIRRVEYEKMVEMGLFEDERIELLASVLVQMSPSGPAHAHAIRRLTELFVIALQGRAMVGPQLPIEVHRDPRPTGYDSVVRAGRGETIAARRFPDLLVAIDDVIPS